MSSNTRELNHKLFVSLSRLGRAFFSENCLHPQYCIPGVLMILDSIGVYQLPAFCLLYAHPDLNPILSQLFSLC